MTEAAGVITICFVIFCLVAGGAWDSYMSYKVKKLQVEEKENDHQN